jgi:predicted DNA-binding protein (UPF0251 family)
MPRPFCCRRVGFNPRFNYFKPRGIPTDQLQEIVMTLDETEAIRLADLNGMYQEQAAECMNISRPTFGRIIESAHRKIAGALIEGKVLKIEKGIVEITETKKYKCNDCRFEIDIPSQSPHINQCPQCGGDAIHQSKEDLQPTCHKRKGRKRGSP